MGYLPEGMPLPDTQEIDTRDWWAACTQHKLVVQHCTRCGTFRHPPVPVCYNCHSLDFEWKNVSGKGTIYSYIVCYHPAHEIIRLHGPPSYNVVLVELPDAGNVRMLGNLVDCPNEELRVGMPIEVAWEEKEGVVLPQWKRAQR